MTKRKRSKPDDLKRLQRALRGAEGLDQEILATRGLAWVATLLRKNADYGSTIFHSPRFALHLKAGDGILVRMSDKVDRLATLLGRKMGPEVAETIEDTMTDLGAYTILYLCLGEKQRREQRRNHA